MRQNKIRYSISGLINQFPSIDENEIEKRVQYFFFFYKKIMIYKHATYSNFERRVL